jgi:hypothetical protein
MSTVKVIVRKTKGGPGSGNWGHSGRPGMVGGSSPKGRSSSAHAQDANTGRIASHYNAPRVDNSMVDKLQELGPWDPTSAANELGVSSWGAYSRDERRWVSGAESDAKDDIAEWLKHGDGIREVSLYGIWSVDSNKGKAGTFEEWLDASQTLYRGGGRSYPFMSFAFNARVAKDASGGAAVWKVITTPRQWLGASQSGAGEVWIESDVFDNIPAGEF